jgi:hypothetical protein
MRGGGVAAHLPAVKVVGGLHGVSGTGMSSGGGCLAGGWGRIRGGLDPSGPA